MKNPRAVGHLPLWITSRYKLCTHNEAHDFIGVGFVRQALANLFSSAKHHETVSNLEEFNALDKPRKNCKS